MECSSANTFSPRNLSFDLSSAGSAWLADDYYATHMFDASSLFLPSVEGFVIYIANKSAVSISDKYLTYQSDVFSKQETYHSREHIKYNNYLKANGYYSEAVIEKIRNKLTSIKSRWSVLSQLAVGVGFENITMNVSYTVLQENILSTASDQMQSFWRWHMVEELEHKSVLMDLYQKNGGGYFRRIFINSMVLYFYCYYALIIYLQFLSVSKVSKWRGFYYLFTKNNFFVKSLVRSLSFYKFNYHPSKLKVGHLLFTIDR